MWRPQRETVWGAFTTVANWRSYGSIEYAGVHLGQKAHSFRDLIELPARSTESLRVAIDIHPGDARDVAALDGHGWARVEPARVAATPGRFARFVRGSIAEIGIAKSGYVNTRCGWISERSACYLAAGRPVVAQGTGMSGAPSGAGLLTFHDVDGAARAMSTVVRDYPRQRAAALAYARAEFDSRSVLTPLMASAERQL
jgi:hypothetical protein